VVLSTNELWLWVRHHLIRRSEVG